MEKGMEQGIKQGREQGLEQGKLQNQRQILVDYVEVRFSELTMLAKERAEAINDLTVLQRMTHALFSTQSVERARLILLEAQGTNGTLS